MNILVIDDSREDRDLIITYIKQGTNGEEVIADESNCLKDALKKVSLNNYDVILLDLGLPESDGLETIKIIQKHMDDLSKNIPIIILTGLEDYAMGREAFILGVKDYLNKDEMHSQKLSRSINFARYHREKQAIN